MASGRKRVGFTPEAVTQSPEGETSSGGHNTPLQRSDVSHEELAKSVHKALGSLYPAGDLPEPAYNVQKPRPAIRKPSRTPPQILVEEELEEFDDEKKRSGLEAQKRAAKLSKSVGTYSAPGSRRNSQERLISPQIERDLRHQYDSSGGETTDDDDEPEHMRQARQLYRHHTMRAAPAIRPEDLYHSDILASGQVTPMRGDVEVEEEHVPRPAKFRTGVLGTLLKASAPVPAPSARNTKVTGHGRNPSHGTLNTFSDASTAANSPRSSPPTSGTSTPRHGRPWFGRSEDRNSVSSISRLIETSSMLATPAQKDVSHEMEEQYKKVRPGMGKRTKSDTSIGSAFSKLTKSRRDDELKIKIHLAGTLARQNYLRKLCKALMMYGAPTHRLEEYMNMSARVLEIEAQFLYMPGCMIIAFDDSSVHTSEVKLVRTAQGVDLGRLRDVHEIYKDVVHDRIGVEEATTRLEAILSRKPKFGAWLRVPMYGLASATVGPFAFQARPIDLPFCFVLGCFLGWLQLIVAPGNEMISNVFEIGAAVITSFIARGLGSIPGSDGEPLFCFSAMAQSSIALILPGFTVLSASLELQSKHIVAGSVRMVYAIIYSLFLGFGITIGTVLFGMMYKDATSQTQCKEPMSSHWYYLFVLGFSLCLMVINQAKWKQMPAMLVIALIGYVVNYHSSQFFTGNAQVSNTLGALAIGIAANLHARFGRHVENWSLDTWETHLRPRYVRLRKQWLRRRHGPRKKALYQAEEYSHSCASSVASDPYIPYTRKIGYGLAAAAMLPAIFVQVPSGLSVQGSLVSGITSADQIVHNTTTGGATTVTATSASSINSVALNVGFSVIQIAIGITVGLFLAALLVYPLGKRRSGLFSF
ncbi:DUF1212-domain-containing protein [Trematosphaeria pertusa]|uniref:DUF1212-domain-containing protein n=1 Tax=Trematosphaeria pertusa TaxID=390896 RepID=A0A6A6IIZ6_9PLEO|nr:DUF1212-domain-containing protein [Trematosphaeria pertusa]KAF2250381.1 DUF1212-domain-containing protein [Trematosphaeria pertusa]